MNYPNKWIYIDFLFFVFQVIGKMKRTPGSAKGAEILGVHVEGPFINTNKKGAHDLKYIKKFDKVRNHKYPYCVI